MDQLQGKTPLVLSIEHSREPRRTLSSHVRLFSFQRAKNKRPFLAEEATGESSRRLVGSQRLLEVGRIPLRRQYMRVLPACQPPGDPEPSHYFSIAYPCSTRMPSSPPEMLPSLARAWDVALHLPTNPENVLLSRIHLSIPGGDPFPVQVHGSLFDQPPRRAP